MEDHAVAQENLYGEMAAIRFFDPTNEDDVALLKEITDSSQYVDWMDEAEPQTNQQLQEWMQDRNKNSFLVAVSGSEGVELPEIGRVQGFVWLYPSKDHDGSYEVSYAKRQNTPSGQIASALRQMLLKYNFIHHNTGSENSPSIEVYSNPWKKDEHTELRIRNEKSIKVSSEAGFEPVDDWEWKLNWQKLNDIVHSNGEAKSLPVLAKLVTSGNVNDQSK